MADGLLCGHAAGSHYPDLFEAMSQEAITHIKNFSQQNLANLAWAYGKVAHDDPLLLDAIAQQACSMIKVSTLFQRSWQVPLSGTGCAVSYRMCQ